MSRNNETKLAGVQVVGYGHPTIFVIENVNEGTVAVMHSGLPWQARQSEAMSHCLSSVLDSYLRNGLIRWAKGRPVREGDELVMPKPVVHPSQEAFAKAAAFFTSESRKVKGHDFSNTAGMRTSCYGKTPDVSAGFGQDVIDHAAKQTKQEAEIATLNKDVARLKIAVGQLNYRVLMGNYGR